MRLPRAIRAAGARLVRNVSFRIESGPNEGLKWSLASSGRGYRTGHFEADRIDALYALTRPGNTVWDIGAHKGYVTMAMARRVGPSGSVVAFEPSAENLWFLRAHVRWNGLHNIHVLPVAASDRDGHARFGGRGSSVTFRLGQGDEQVRMATLETMAREEDLSTPDVMKIDVEGSEGAVLEGAGDLISEEAVLFISVHGRACYDECHTALRSRGFRIHESAELAIRLADPSLPWGADHELLALGPSHPATEESIESLRLLAPP